MKKIALIIGHSAKNQGAVNDNSGVTEFMFNKPLAFMIATVLAEAGHHPIVMYRETSYTKLPLEVNKTGADLAVSLHCNAFDDNPHGSETLHYESSSRSKLLAQSIQTEVVNTLGLKDRGVKPRKYDHVGKAGDRGGYLLRYTNMPCVISEAFFIDSDQSLKQATADKQFLANAIARGIINYIEKG